MAANRVIRGGSWINNAVNCRSANRNRNAPGNRNDNVGFRLSSTLLLASEASFTDEACVQKDQSPGRSSRAGSALAKTRCRTARGSCLDWLTKPVVRFR